MIRFSVGPSPTTASFTTNPSGFRLALFSALAMALFSVLLIRNAAFFGVKVSRSSAAETGRPWISRVTSRALNGEIRAYLYIDLTSISVIQTASFRSSFEQTPPRRSGSGGATKNTPPSHRGLCASLDGRRHDRTENPGATRLLMRATTQTTFDLS